MTDAPIILWFRRDLRLADHPMLIAAAATGRPLIPVFILDEVVEALGAAPKWRLGLAASHFADVLKRDGSRLILRRGDAATVLKTLVAETGAVAVWWSRLYDAVAKARDTAVKSSLKSAGIDARSYPGHVLFEPMDVATGEGGYYKVYSPFWRAVKDRNVPRPDPACQELRIPDKWPTSDKVPDWNLGRAMNRGAAVVLPYLRVGEAAALERLDRFIETAIDSYKERRDFPAEAATSGLAENLTYGEIGARTVWYAGQAALAAGAKGAEHFLKELVWREFAYHLTYHTPHILERNWRPEWNDFAWRKDNSDAEKWRRGITGEPFVDAAMREMYVTGTMHNRSRMIVASYLTKHLLTDWRVGLKWFEDCLVDWDPASNALGWQWVAGSGPDAAPYFRVFNPAGQAEKFDANASYRDRWLAEGRKKPSATSLSYFQAVPRSWGLDPARNRPEPVVALETGRKRALDAYAARNGRRD